MRRFSLIILLFLSAALSATAQVRYGLMGSVQASNVASTVDLTSLGPTLGTLTVPINQRVGFRAGLMADVPVTDRLSIQPQLLYSVKGGNVDVGTFVGTVLTKFGLPSTTFPIETSISRVVVNYIELPVLALYSIDAGPGRLRVGAGPYAAVAVSGSVNGAPINFNTDGFHKHDLGATASVGYELPLGLNVSVYYAHGLTNFSKNATPNLSSLNPTNPTASLDPSAFGGTLRNRSYGFSIGYFIK
ncbi:porin family protein [Fibrella forsythiae]|uniref:PorT family protein n=1 Tax=Fibrella forsythiae TaxID=2817061 RepID=A0ABS3JIZ2_9BACT|nr:porin family protein [Fibrella forsythiae]MBO0949974.1 PorT family protein [Fibrella forsythiae]